MEHFKSMTNKEAIREANEFAIQQTTEIQKLLAGNDEGLKAIDGITGYGNSTFDRDPYMSAFKAGKREVSVILHDMIDRDIKKAKSEMEKENG